MTMNTEKETHDETRVMGDWIEQPLLSLIYAKEPSGNGRRKSGYEAASYYIYFKIKYCLFVCCVLNAYMTHILSSTYMIVILLSNTFHVVSSKEQRTG